LAQDRSMSKLEEIRALGRGEMERRFKRVAHPEEGPRVVHPSMERDIELEALKVENAKLKAEIKALKRIHMKPVVSTSALPKARVVSTPCPVCEARKQAKTASQRKWRKRSGTSTRSLKTTDPSTSAAR
jgi:hypothetical protein